MVTRIIALLFFMTMSAHAADSPLAGTWQLTGADEVKPDGAIVEPYGAHPVGLLIVDRDGRYSLQIFRGDRTPFTDADKRKGTPEEFAAAVMAMSTHFGTCTVDAASNTLIFRIEHAAFPNWDGATQRRRYVLNGDDLSYEIPPSATGNGSISRSRWHRVR